MVCSELCRYSIKLAQYQKYAFCRHPPNPFLHDCVSQLHFGETDAGKGRFDSPSELRPKPLFDVDVATSGRSMGAICSDALPLPQRRAGMRRVNDGERATAVRVRLRCYAPLTDVRNQSA